MLLLTLSSIQSFFSSFQKFKALNVPFFLIALANIEELLMISVPIKLL
jgi:hypothetical protein